MPLLPDGIIVQASDVTIDLKGFTLQGGAGGGNGINVPSAVKNLKVYNGVIRDWALSGVDASKADNGELNGATRVQQRSGRHRRRHGLDRGHLPVHLEWHDAWVEHNGQLHGQGLHGGVSSERSRHRALEGCPPSPAVPR